MSDRQIQIDAVEARPGPSVGTFAVTAIGINLLSMIG
jgi:hypothetical protein